jgi:hypothetical protein
MIGCISVTQFDAETGAELNILTTAHARMPKCRFAGIFWVGEVVFRL